MKFLDGDIIEFLTQLVLLAIAVFGLYRTWQYGEKHSTSGEQAGKKAKSNSFFLQMGEIYGAMLLPALFVLGFMFLINLLNSVNNIDEETATNAPIQLEIDEATPELEIMLAVALRINNSVTRGRELIDLVSRALERGDIELAIRAATAIPNDVTSDKQLQRILSEVPKTSANGTHESGVGDTQ